MFAENPYAQKSEVQELAEGLRKEAVNLLRQEGYVNMFDWDAVISIFTAPVFILTHLGEFTPPNSVTNVERLKRFCQLTQASYLHKVSREGAMATMALFADDGNPNRARIIQFGNYPGSEFLQLNLSSGQGSRRVDQALLLCTRENPAFANIAPHLDWPSIQYDGARFDGAGAKRLRVATTEDLKMYHTQLGLSPTMSNITNANFISWEVKPDFAR